MNGKCLLILLGALAPGLAACHGGSGGGGSNSNKPVAPSGLQYGNDFALLLLGVATTPDVPTVDGDVTSWSVDPPLPLGLALDAQDGTLSGTPTEARALADYRITAMGPAGETDAVVQISVDAPPRFAYAANQSDDTLSVYVVDAWTGELRHHGFEPTGGGEGGPEQVVVHPSGAFLYAPELGTVGQTSVVSVYAIDAATGRLTFRSTAATGIGPHRLVLSPDGAYAYVSSQGSDTVRAFEVDPVDGALTPNGPAIAAPGGPHSMSVDPLGRFVFVLHRTSPSVSIFRIDPQDGRLSPTAAPVLISDGIPAQAAIDTTGENLYVVVEGADVLRPYAIDPTSGALLGGGEQPTGTMPTSVAVHPTGKFVYVTNFLEETVSAYAIDELTAEITPAGSASTGEGPNSLHFDDSGLFAYVVDGSDNDVAVYAVDPKTGDLARRGAFRTRQGPVSLGMTFGTAPTRHVLEWLYTANHQSNDVSGYQADEQNGALTSLGTTFPVGDDAKDMAVDPLGRFAWVINALDNSLSILAVDGSTGTLVDAGTPFDLGTEPSGVAVDPSGRYLFVCMRTVDAVQSFTIDQQTGMPTALDVATSGLGPSGVAVDPTGQFVYVSANAANEVGAYRVEDGMFVTGPIAEVAPGMPQEVRFAPRGDFLFLALRRSQLVVPYAIDATTGALTVLGGGSHTTGSRPIVLDVHPSGRWAYSAVHGSSAGNDGYVGRYDLDPDTGTLTNEVQVFGGLRPHDVVVDPSGRFVYSVNELGDDVSAWSVDQTTGDLTSIGQVPAGTKPRAIGFVSRVD